MSKVQEFFNSIGRVYLGPAEIDEPTAAKLLKVIKEINDGKFNSSEMPKEWVTIEKDMKKVWEEKFCQ